MSQDDLADNEFDLSHVKDIAKLSDDAIIALAEKHLVLIDNSEFTFARAIEAEVHKQDTALILQLVEALEVATTPLAADRQEVLRAVTAGRARLEGKP